MVLINGEDVHVGFVVMNTLWVVVSLAFLPFLSMQLHRIYKLATRAANPSAFYGLCLQWAHIGTIWLCYFVSGFDVSHAYVDESQFLVGVLLSALNMLRGY